MTPLTRHGHVRKLSSISSDRVVKGILNRLTFLNVFDSFSKEKKITKGLQEAEKELE